MSVPVLLTVLDASSASAASAVVTQAVLLDEHIASCASYVDAATLIPPAYISAASDELDVAIDLAKTPPCTPTLQNFTMQLRTQLAPNERMGLTGDSKSLGEWQLDRSIALTPETDTQWSANVMLQACRNISYRYFVYVEDLEGRKKIRRWETQLKPRNLKPGNNQNQVDTFGGDAQGEPQVNRGWLTNESIIQFKFVREQMLQVKNIEKFDPEDVLIKIMPLKSDMETFVNPNDIHMNIETVKFKYGESQLQPQAPFGISYKRGDVIVFHLTVAQSLPVAFAVMFHTPAKQPMGKAIVRSSDLVGSEGVLELNVTSPEASEHDNGIATLTLPYLYIRPLADVNLDFRATYAHYWPRSWPNLDVGHRGNGRSFIAEPPAERENTLASFLRSYESFADMVELDVHLTSDHVPIIYHDFGVRTAPKGKTVTSAKQLEYVLIKDLSYDALKDIRVFSVIKDQPVEFPSHNAEPRVEHRIFPTLDEVLVGLPKTLGIDVEIKWPQLVACGGEEAVQTIDKNFFVDRVLGSVITKGCNRALVFSSFDADICAMLRFKQNIFPVMFLTMGETKKWEPYLDLRTRTFEQAINNAQAFELAGTAPHAEDFLGEDGAQLMRKARNLNQVTLVWGNDINSKERVRYFGQIGATAVCYDRTDLYMPESKERSFFNSSNVMAEFNEPQ